MQPVPPTYLHALCDSPTGCGASALRCARSVSSPPWHEGILCRSIARLLQCGAVPYLCRTVSAIVRAALCAIHCEHRMVALTVSAQRTAVRTVGRRRAFRMGDVLFVTRKSTGATSCRCKRAARPHPTGRLFVCYHSCLHRRGASCALKHRRRYEFVTSCALVLSSYTVRCTF